MAPSVAAVQVAAPGSNPIFNALSWMILSSSMIVFNKYMLGVAKFPITLTFLHLATTTIITQVLARCTPLITRPNTPITGRLYLRTILPIGLLYTLSLICANASYTTLPLPNIQILKALAPLTTLSISWLVSFANPKLGNMLAMGWIAVGACISNLGALSLAGRGLWLCLVGTAAECGRALILEKLLKEPRRGRFPGAGTPVSLEEGEEEGPTVAAGEMAMSPLVALYYFAPVCAFLSGCMALAFEYRSLSVGEVQRVGVVTLVLSCVLAFLLNVAGVFLISQTTALNMSLLGIVKSPVPILATLLIWNTPMTYLQVMGYGLSLTAMIYHVFTAEGVGEQVDAWLDPLMARAVASLGNVVRIEPLHIDEEARGRTGHREATPRAVAEKTSTSSDDSNKGGESLSVRDVGRLD